jgi:putative ABC transport system substrate-binding protein
VRRREFITLVGGAAAGWPLAARAQQPDRTRRIGVLMGAAVQTDQQAGLAVFKETLHQLGWIDGRNVRVEVRWAGGDPVEARKDAEELVALPADVIMAAGQLPLQALLQATRSVPIVFNSIIDPVGSGYIDSLARPGGNERPDTLMQDRTSPTRRNLLATHGRTIHRGQIRSSQ